MKIGFFIPAAIVLLTSNVVPCHSQQAANQVIQPRIIGWTDDNNYLIQTTDEGRTITQSVEARTGRAKVLTDFKTDREKLIASLPGGYIPGVNDIVSPDNKCVVIPKGKDLYYLSTLTGGELRLTNDESEEMNTRFSPDSKKLAYTKNKDLYVFDLISMKEIRLTNDATNKIYNGWASWVYFEEILGRPSRYAAFWWSPDGEKIAYLHTDDNPVPEFTLVRLDQPDGVNGRTEVTPYPKPGDRNPVVKMGIANISTGKTTWVKTDTRVDQYLAWPFWKPDSRQLAVQVLNRDQNDLRILLTDINTGDYKEIYRETRPTWVDFYEDIYVMQNGEGFIVRSYRNDWENLYFHGWDGSLKSQITNFGFRVLSIDRVDEEAKLVYLSATGEKSTDKQCYRVSLDGKNLVQITKEDGTHNLNISPKGTWFIDTWNSVYSPGATVLLDKSAKAVRDINRPEMSVFDASKHQRTELLKITTSDGLFDMPALITYPVGFSESNKYPVVFTIYGGPDAGRVRNTWAGNNPGWYAQNGIITISVDHRASGQFGKKGLDYMHRNLGKWEILDYADAVKWLRAKPYVDPTRMGITGGSYGGYMTCLALTKGADYWTHGVANSSVTDWKLYDNVYTERYMDEPKDNISGYNDGSVLTFADRLEGKLLLTHGDVDDNVHLQNSIHLISRFQDLSKNFEFMIFPGERHGLTGTKRSYNTNITNKFWLREFFGK